MPWIARIVSGGQTGVDRAALEFGRRVGVPIGGWCPAGGWAEDLPDPPGLLAEFPELDETRSSHPAQRTRWNVRDSDATLVLVRGEVSSPGTAATITFAEDFGRPHLVADVEDVVAVRAWLVDLPGRQRAERRRAPGEPGTRHPGAGVGPARRRRRPDPGGPAQPRVRG